MASSAFSRSLARFRDRGMHDARATYGERMVFYEITGKVNRISGDAWPSQETIARNLGMKNTRTVIRAVKKWVDLGYYKIEVDGRNYSYRPVFSESDTGGIPDKLSPITESSIGDKKADDGDKNRTSIGDKNIHLSSLREPIERTSLRSSSSASSSVPRDERRSAEQERERPEVVQSRIANKLGRGDNASGWLILGTLSDSARHYLTSCERSGVLTTAIINTHRERAHAEMRRAYAPTGGVPKFGAA